MSSTCPALQCLPDFNGVFVVRARQFFVERPVRFIDVCGVFFVKDLSPPAEIALQLFALVQLCNHALNSGTRWLATQN